MASDRLLTAFVAQCPQRNSLDRLADRERDQLPVSATASTSTLSPW